jgi:putative transposase
MVTAASAILLYHPGMSHTHASNLVHCVFSTKDRANLIKHPDALGRYISGIATGKHITLVAAGGTANHIHLLISLPPAMPLAQAMRDLKGNSSRVLGEMGHSFSWQEGYGAFSVSHSQRQVVADYIANQEAHHRKWSFEQEFVALLRKAGVEYDARYVFG